MGSTATEASEGSNPSVSALLLKPGSFIVFEGLDKTGKSTQARKLQERLAKQGPVPLFTHQPSGKSYLTRSTYLMLEHFEMPALSRQLFHLACHDQQYEYEIIPHLKNGVPVVMDRFWMSTIAYGYFRERMEERVTLNQFEWLAQLPTQGYMPDLVFMFFNPYKNDELNTERLAVGYSVLFERHRESCVLVPTGTEEEIHEFICRTLVEKGVAETLWPSDSRAGSQ